MTASILMCFLRRNIFAPRKCLTIKIMLYVDCVSHFLHFTISLCYQKPFIKMVQNGCKCFIRLISFSYQTMICVSTLLLIQKPESKQFKQKKEFIDLKIFLQKPALHLLAPLSTVQVLNEVSNLRAKRMPLPQPWEPFLDNLCVWECVHWPGLLFLSLQLTVQLSTGQNNVDQTDFEVELLKGKKRTYVN